jgi:hypothetical protein
VWRSRCDREVASQRTQCDATFQPTHEKWPMGIERFGSGGISSTCKDHAVALFHYTNCRFGSLLCRLPVLAGPVQPRRTLTYDRIRPRRKRRRRFFARRRCSDRTARLACGLPFLWDRVKDCANREGFSCASDQSPAAHSACRGHIPRCLHFHRFVTRYRGLMLVAPTDGPFASSSSAQHPCRLDISPQTLGMYWRLLSLRVENPGT